MSAHDEPVAFVTGGARGIGYGIAERLAGNGWRVVIADIDGDAGREAAEAITRSGSAEFRPCDVTDEASVSEAMTTAHGEHGRLDGLVNNAGVADPHGAPVEQLELADWRAVLDTNLTGAFLCTKHAAAHLRERGAGAIVNIASTRALQSEPDSEAYAASKGGLLALTHALAISLGPTIRVNAVSPGWIDVSRIRPAHEQYSADIEASDHAQHPAGRVGTVADIAALTAFLLSEEAAFITGQNHVADGGMSRRMIYGN